MRTEVPEDLREAKDCFFLQCALGCRISDFKALTMEKVSVGSEGIPYIHYLPKKTMRSNFRHEEIETPLLRYAVDIINKRKFKFPLLKLRNRSTLGKRNYNQRIKEILEYCGIDRQCKVFDEERGDNVYHPLYTFGSSKLCRKTHVDMMNKVQVNMYAAGLHKWGSPAVERYTSLRLRDRFVLMCAAFDQPFYKAVRIGDELVVTEEADRPTPGGAISAE